MIEVCINGCPLILEDGDVVYMGIRPPDVLGDFSPVTICRRGKLEFALDWVVYEGAEDCAQRWMEAKHGCAPTRAEFEEANSYSLSPYPQ